jgi:hypothetical protein
MANGGVLNGTGKVNVETELVMIIGQLNWFADQIEDLEQIAPSLVLRGMVKQLEALVDPIADLRMGVQHG